MTEPTPAVSVSLADRWSAILLPDGRGAVERGGYGDVPERVLGLTADGTRWSCDSAGTRRVLDAVFVRGESADLTHVYDDPCCGPRTLEFAFAPLVVDSARIGIAVHCTEATARVAQVRAAQRHVRILESMGEGVLLVTSAGTIAMANAAADAMLSQVLGRVVDAPVSALGLPFSRFVLAAPHTHASTADAPFEFARRDGGVLATRCTVRDCAESDGTRVVVLRDVTERRRLEREAADAVRLERERLARELHDGIGQELTAVALLLRGVATWVKRDRADVATELDRVIELVNGVIGGARSMAHGLVEPAGAELDLVAALERLARSRNALVGPRVTFESTLDEPPPLPARAVTELVHVAQEASANALRHSGAAHIDIRVGESESGLELVVEDDGCGFDCTAVGAGGMGLGIMRFRARSIGAELEVQPRVGGGTRVRCVLRLG